MTQPDGILPLRGLAVGVTASVLISLVAALVVQSSVFGGRPATPTRVPPLDQSRPLTPVAFIAGLRPSQPAVKGQPLFTVSTNAASSNYLEIASVDYYDGDGWTFNRTFRPSGGSVPGETDPTLQTGNSSVVQTYQISPGPMTTVPWMPYLYRAQQVTGAAINIDAQSGMIVPARALRAGASYTVRSSTASAPFAALGRQALPATSAPPIDTELPGNLRASLGTLVASLATETGSDPSQVVPYLQAVANDFRSRSALSGASATPTPTVAATTPTAAASTPTTRPAHRTSTAHRAAPGHAAATKRPRGQGHRSSAAPFLAPRVVPVSTPAPSPPSSTPSPSSTPNNQTGAGTTYANVLTSVRQLHSATPEQYATLMALVARELNVPARVVTGFRLPTPAGSSALQAGTYRVTSAQAWTWVEIPVRGHGWVVLDPSPSTYAGQQARPSVGTTPSVSSTPSPSGNAQLTQSGNGHATAPKSAVPTSHGIAAVSVLAIVLVIAGAVIVLILLVLLLRKRLRARRRRRPGDPRKRLVGAWQESLDVLVEAGLPDLTFATSSEVASATGARFGGEPAAQARFIGDAANAAIFNPTAWIESAQADAAWEAEQVLRKAIRNRLDWRGRLGSRLRYHRPTRVRPQPGPASWSAAARAHAQAVRVRRRPRGRHFPPRSPRFGARHR